MYINLITLNPDFFKSFLKNGLIYKAIKNNILFFNFFNPRLFLSKNDKNINDKIYGGGPGLLIKSLPIYLSIRKAKKICKNYYIIYLSPQGDILNKVIISKLLEYKSIIFICGRYSGIDQRIIDKYVDFELSIGDYILSCGEISSLVVIDVLVRHIPGIINNLSNKFDSFYFNNGLLSYPNYTKPKIFNNMKVPKVLLSGNHNNIKDWRIKQSFKNTKIKKKYLIKKKY